MPLDPLLLLAALLLIGGIAQWLGWVIRLPSILLLLLFGFLAGPVAGLIRPQELFGDLLSPFVAICVALILFEGGLSLNWAELRGSGRVVFMLVSLGAVITWILAATAACWLIHLELGLAIVLGAILTVTGPTVVLPLLRHIRPVGPVAAILKWEGIVIDPIGAVLAVIAFEVVAEGHMVEAMPHALLTIARTLALGGALGAVGAALLALAIRRFWIPDRLLTMAATVLVVTVFAGSNYLLHESGLAAVTIMGIVLANQRSADMRSILEFKENLRVFLLSLVFVLLSANLQLADLARVGVGTALFLVVLLLVVRPVSVLVSTWGSRLSWRERLFISWMAPRGIVAAAVTSVFALALEERGYPQARLLVPVMFTTIVGTVLVYGLTSGPFARRMKVADPDPQGLLIVGADAFARDLAKAVHQSGARVLLVDSNRQHVVAAQMAGLNTHFGSILAEDVLDKLDLTGLGKLIALTSNDEVNSLAVQRFAHLFGRAAVFQLVPEGAEKGKARLARQFFGRLLFRQDATCDRIGQLMAAGATVRTTKLTADFDFQAFQTKYGDAALPLLVYAEPGRLTVLTAQDRVEIRPNQTLVSLAPSRQVESEANAGATTAAASTA